ncbi:MAG TPA: hypothetical protein VFK57_12360 [Vicinamibacterales bacterium]|nr:hypothetical protein [Vicinamibacterales bacterium]
MIIRFTLGRALSRRRGDQPGLDGMRLETHPSGLNRTDSRRLSAREIAHRERMLAHLHRTLRESSSPFPAR